MIVNYVYRPEEVVGGNDDVTYSARIDGTLTIDLSQSVISKTGINQWPTSSSASFVARTVTGGTTVTKGSNPILTLANPTYSGSSKSVNRKNKYYYSGDQTVTIPQAAFSWSGTGTGIAIISFRVEVSTVGTGHTASAQTNSSKRIAVMIVNGTLIGIKMIDWTLPHTYQEALSAYNSGDNSVVLPYDGSKIIFDTQSEAQNAVLRAAASMSEGGYTFYPDPTPN